MTVAAATSSAPAAPRASIPVASAASGEDFGALLETATVEDAPPDAKAATDSRPGRDGAVEDESGELAKDKTEVQARTANDGLLAGATALALQPQPVAPAAQDEAPVAAAQPAETPAPPQPAPVPPQPSSPPAAAVQAATAAVAAVAALDAQDTDAAPIDADGAPTEGAGDVVPGGPASAGSNASAAIDALSKMQSGAAKDAPPAPTPDAALLQSPAATASKATEAPANAQSNAASNALDAAGASKHDPSEAKPDAGDPTKTGAATGKSADAAAPSTTTRTATPAPAVMPQPTEAAAPPVDVTAAGQPTAAAASATPAVAVTHAALSGLSHATAETMVHLAAQITRRLEGRSTQFEMTLTPEGLGRVDVSLDIDADGKLAARLAFDNPLAATDMKGRADELRRQLEDAGFSLGQDALEFSQRDGSAPGDGFDRRRNQAFANASRNALDADAAVQAPAAWMSLTLTPRGVDMKV